jgi:hypothetical protein
MGTGYTSTLGDIQYLFNVASDSDRDKVAGRLSARIEKTGGGFRYFDQSGSEISVEELHRRSQVDPEIQRGIYNMWMTYAH